MRGLIFLVILFSPLLMTSQSFDAELNGKLEGKQIFNEIKKTVLDHYNAQLNALSFSDSVTRGQIMRQLKKWNRKFWISEYYTDKDGIVQNAHDINLAGFDALKRMSPKESTRHQPNNWTQQGPTWSNKGIGRFDKIAFHPSDQNIIFAGSPHGGLFKTLDGGNNWDPISSFLPSLGISGIAIHPSNPDIIYVLTGDAHTPDNYFVDEYLYRSDSKGVFKSVDGGNSWQKTGQLSSNEFRGRELIINPSNPQILIAATSLGLYRTADGGQVWTLVPNSGGDIADVKFKPGDPNIVYFVDGDQFWRSENGGLTVNLINVPQLVGANRISIGVTQANPNRVVLLAGPKLSNTTFQGIFSSNDSGQTFTRLTQTPNVFSNTIGNSLYSDFSDYINTIAISPLNENDIFVGGLCVWKSTNGGVNWSQASAYWPNDNPFMHPDIQELRINPLNNKLYCANDGGVYLFENNAWTIKYNGLTTSQFYHFERENENGKIWGGLQDNGTQIHTVGGNYNLKAFGDGYDQITDHSYNTLNGNSDDAYYTANTKVEKILNGVIYDISVPGNNSFFGNLAIDPNSESTIYVGYSQATYKSSDKGNNWIALTNGANTQFPGNWCISTSGSSIIAAGSSNANYGSGIRKYNSLNGIENFTPQLVQAGYSTSLKITDIDINPNNLNGIYISVGGIEPTKKVFCSNNSGVSWSNITFNLPNVPIFSIKADLGGGLYVGTSIGVFYKPTNYTHWQPFSNALPPVPVTEIELDNANNTIYISTFGRGIWTTQKYTPNCNNHLPLTGDLRGVHYKESNLTITSTQQILGGEGSNVKYNTGDRITLTDGFRAWHGCSFKTYLTGCGGVVD
jgi:photosystem II stability/assembly factor-like uncharacterized protein